MTAGVVDQTVAPDSKPGLPSFWPGLVQPPPPVGLTVQVNVALPDCAPLVAVTVTEEVPAVVGGPLMTPVEALMDSPAGRPVADQEKLAGPPDAVTVRLTGGPTVLGWLP